MTSGKEAFESAAEIGVGKSYNNKQFAQIFKGIRASIEDASAEAGRDPIVDDGNTGAQPPTEYPDPDYPALEAGDIWIDANGSLNFYYNGQWNQVKVYTKNVLPNDDSPLRIITPNGEAFDNQKEYNEWLYTRTDRQPIHSDTPPLVHPDFPAYELRDGDYWIDYNNHLYFWDYSKQAWVPIAGSNARTAIYSPTPPTLHPDYDPPEDALVAGDTWYDTDNYFKQYVYNGTDWILVTNYVSKEGGDSMEGPLKVTGDRSNSTVETLNVDSGENSSLQLKQNGTTTVYVGKNDLTLTTDLKFNNPNKHIYAGADKKGIEVNTNGILYKGDMSAADHLITKEYSDLADQELDAKVTELRVEIDALAPIDASGIYRWQDMSSPRPPSAGQFVLLSEDLTETVDKYGESGGIWIHQTDWEGVAHDFTEVHVGELIQLFDRYEPEFVLGEIIEVQTGGLQADHTGSLIIKYERISSIGGPDYGSGADPLVNFKVYRKPTDDGTGASAYLPIKGGTMQGAIDMEGNKIKFHGDNPSTDHIHFTRDEGVYVNALRLNHGGGLVNGGYDIRLIGNTSYNWLRLCGLGNGDSPLVTARASGEIKFVHDNIRFNNNKLRDVAPAVSDTDAVNLGQIKERLAELRDEFLQDLIVGTWGVDNVQSLVSPGTNRMCFVKSNGQAAQKFSETAIIRFYYQDDQGSEVLWDHWDPGELVTFRQLDDPSVTAVFRLQSSVNVNGTVRSFPVEFVNAQNDNNPFGQYLERYAVTLTEFSDGFNGAELDTLYYRVDGSNGPLTEPVTVSTNNEYGDAELILEGKRDNPNNAVGVLRFTNVLSTDGPGEITYYTYGSTRKFTFNENVDFTGNTLSSVGSIKYTSTGGVVTVGNTIKMTIQNGTSSSNGQAQVHISRAPGSVRRTFAISGKNTSGSITDILYAYTRDSGGDYIVYQGDTNVSSAIQTKKSVENLIAAAYQIDEQGDLHFYDHRLEDVGTPVVETDAATKGYVDTSIETAIENIDGGGGDYAPSNHVHSQYHASENSTSLLLANHTKIAQSSFATSNHSHSNYASSSHNHNTSYVKGNYTITKSNGNYYIS